MTTASGVEGTRLTVSRFDPGDIARGKRELLLDVSVPADELGLAAVLWLEREVPCAQSLARLLQQRFTGERPPDGYRAVLNKPEGLAFIATWPGAVLSADLRFVSARESQ